MPIFDATPVQEKTQTDGAVLLSADGNDSCSVSAIFEVGWPDGAFLLVLEQGGIDRSMDRSIIGCPRFETWFSL